MKPGFCILALLPAIAFTAPARALDWLPVTAELYC